MQSQAQALKYRFQAFLTGPQPQSTTSASDFCARPRRQRCTARTDWYAPSSISSSSSSWQPFHPHSGYQGPPPAPCGYGSWNVGMGSWQSTVRPVIFPSSLLSRLAPATIADEPRPPGLTHSIFAAVVKDTMKRGRPRGKRQPLLPTHPIG